MRQREPLLSRDWYRVAGMRPRLRSGVCVTRQRLRGQTWYVLSDPVSGRHHRFNDVAYALVASCNGEATLDEVWSARVAAAGDDALPQNEAIRILAQAFAANLFVGDVAPDAAAIVRAQSRKDKRRRRARVNPLAFRLPLWDPDIFLAAQLPRVAWLFGRTAGIAIVLLLGLGALLLAANAPAVADSARRELGAGHMLLLMWLVYPPMKALHELAHAFAVKVHGGEVHALGISLLMLTPVPYVDASSSVAFVDKRARVAVAAAGIVVEAVLASVALALWLLLEPGLARDVAFAVVAVGALSTVLVNGNPLLRFDGYYVLCDLAELPNLATRSARYWQALLQRVLFGLRSVHFGAPARGERRWLLGYAPLAWAYRGAMLALLAVLLAEWSAPLGLAALALGVWVMLLRPALAAARWLLRSGELRGRRVRAGAVTLLGAAALGALAFALPLPLATQAPGIVWLPDDAIVRLGSDGFVEHFLVRDGDMVARGTPIVRLSNELLDADLAKVESQIERQQVERAQQFELDARRVKAAEDELARLGAERDRLQQRRDALLVRAGIAGRVVIDPRKVLVGQYLAQGDVVAQVLPDGAPLVRALVRNEDIALVRGQPGTIGVDLAGSARALHATLGPAAPQASTRLPSQAFGEAAGGAIALDSSDPAGLTAREPRFAVDLRLDSGVDTRVGTRALVDFRHGEASAAALAARFVRRSFLRHFDK